MTRLRENGEYQKTTSYKFFRWLDGTKDPYVGEVEMKPQKEHVAPSARTMRERTREKRMMKESVYDISHNKVQRYFRLLYRIAALIFVASLVYFLLFTISFLPETGVAMKPTGNEVAQRYIESGLQETGSVNIVTGMILTYRAFDTFGETNVLFVATICVMVMLMVDDELLKEEKKYNDRLFEPGDDDILQGMAIILVPVIFIFGIYIILNGQLSPGGGFSGGAILGAGMILYASAFGFHKTQKWFNENVYRVAKVTALCMYGCIGLYYYTCGANGIENHIPLGIAGHILSGGIILPIDICVGIEVACTMYAFYALFRRGGL